MVDINRLCPGCMRGADREIDKAGMRDAAVEAMDNLEWIHVLESVDGDNLVALDRDGRIMTYGKEGIYLTPLDELNRDGEISGDMLAGFVESRAQAQGMEGWPDEGMV